MFYLPEEVNLHTHSFYCKHGNGTIAEYVEQAKKDGIRLLGFSEHCPLPDREYQKGNRMDYPDLPYYEQDVRDQQTKAKEETETNKETKIERNKKETITILLGAECDWLPEEFSFYKDELLGRKNYDYLICSVHHMIDPQDNREHFLGHFTTLPLGHLREYVRQYTDALRSGIFTFGCHPDIFLAGYRRWDSDAISASTDILQCAKQCGIPLEINDNGLRKRPITVEDGSTRQPYPVKEFWLLAKEIGTKIVANSDAHRPIDVAAHKKNAFAFAEQNDIPLSGWELDTESKLHIV